MADGNSTERHPNFKDLTGMKFSKWLVLKWHSRSKARQSLWLCRCECGTEKPVAGQTLVNGTSRSCLTCSLTTHGMSDTPEFRIWKHVIARCCNPNDAAYEDYGERGISVSDEWRSSFEAFFADMGTRPSSAHSIERRNNNGNYEKSNCYWATRSEQQRNKRNNRMLEFDGKIMCVTEWSEMTGIPSTILFGRLKLGWSVEKTLTTPVQIHKRKS